MDICDHPPSQGYKSCSINEGVVRKVSREYYTNIKGLKTEKTVGISQRDEETLVITKAVLKKLASESRYKKK